MELIVALIIGGVAGWLAGGIMKSKSEGVVWNIILGLAGGFFGAWVFQLIGISDGSPGWLGSILTATFGAILLIFLNRLLFKR
ncbi:GlsB/YeaQ/YmgE family stress response membrane protein [Crocinitomix algicola]|uniref:GlsB/YeaQ/YmgE family stress response membrane protein n=1 Tax=Crocinitomix algicola TaxID=1740263 RepID=UPI0008727635|nr:GlsB/YeaQ/YmgE family stress response membrane protein [Crocinitomix algicola]